MPYFRTYNANRRYVSEGLSFIFDPIENFGGSWLGILEVTDETQLAAIKKFDANVGVEEITKEEFDRYFAKKARLPIHTQSSGAVHQLRTAQILDVKVAVRDVATSPIKPEEKSKLKEVEDILVVGTAEFIDPLDVKLNAKPKKRK